MKACIALRQTLKSRYPAQLNAITARKADDNPASRELRHDVKALTVVSAAIALGEVPPARELARVEEVMARGGITVDGKHERTSVLLRRPRPRHSVCPDEEDRAGPEALHDLPHRNSVGMAE